MPILLFFALFILLDFATLFSLGNHIGFLPTVAIVVGTAMLGLHLIRREGLATLRQAQARYLQGEVNSQQLMQGAAYIFAGLLLLMPGTLSDILGLLCLLPFSRNLFTRQILGRTSRMKGFSEAFRERTFSHDASAQTQRTSQDSQEQGNHAHTKQDAPIEGEYIERGDR